MLYFATIYYMLEDGIYKVIGAIVIAVFFFILVCRLLGFQAKLVEGFPGFSNRKKGGDSGNDDGGSLWGSDDSGTHDEAAKKVDKRSKNHLAKSKAGQADLRPGQETVIENLEESLRHEILTHVLDKTKDGKTGKHRNPLLSDASLLGNPDAMALIKNLNELWKFRDTLEAAINTLDNTTATSWEKTGGGIV